jgi:hypothetical protein
MVWQHAQTCSRPMAGMALAMSTTRTERTYNPGQRSTASMSYKSFAAYAIQPILRVTKVSLQLTTNRPCLSANIAIGTLLSFAVTTSSFATNSAQPTVGMDPVSGQGIWIDKRIRIPAQQGGTETAQQNAEQKTKRSGNVSRKHRGNVLETLLFVQRAWSLCRAKPS